MKTADWKIHLSLNAAQCAAVRKHVSAWATTNRVFYTKNPRYQELLDYTMKHPNLVGQLPKYNAKINTRNSPHKDFHAALESMVQDCMKKVREGLKNQGDLLGDEITVSGGAAVAGTPAAVLAASAPPPPPAFAAKPVRFIVIDPTAHNPHNPPAGPRVPHAWNDDSNIVFVGLIENHTLVSLYGIAARALPAGRSIRTLYGALGNPNPTRVDGRPSVIDITELFDDQQVQGWLAMSSAVPITCVVELYRQETDARPNTPPPSGRAHLNELEYRAPFDMFDPPSDSENETRHDEAAWRRRLPKSRDGIERRMEMVRQRRNRQEALLHRLQVLARGTYGPENILEEGEPGWMPNLPPALQAILKARNQADSDTAWAAGPQVTAAVAAGRPAPPNPNPNGLVGLTRRELPHQRLERLIMAWATRHRAAAAAAAAPAPAAAARGGRGGARGARGAARGVRGAGVRGRIAKAARGRSRGRGKGRGG